MFIPKHFNITDQVEALDFIQKNAFGQLISNTNGRLFSTHMPLLLSDDKTTLYGHIALQNPQHLELDGQQTLTTFQGPHAYISPSWYADSGVPTWNYQAVHVYGQSTTFRCIDKLKWLVDALTAKYESAFETPWQGDYNPKMLAAIVGIETSISCVECKYKLNQNRSEQDQIQVIQQLKTQGSFELANVMDRNKSVK